MKRVMSLLLTIVFIMLNFSSCSSLLEGLTESLYMQKDLELVEDGAPAYLLLVEGLIHSNNKNKKMLVTGIQLFSAYSAAFVKDKERSKIFADKSKDWALDVLRTYAKFEKSENKEFDEYKEWVNGLTKSDVPYVFWAANAWIMWIISNSASMEALLDLPKAKVIIDKIYELDDAYYYGAPHLFYGIYYSILPETIGGNKTKAKEEFDKAVEIAGDTLLATKVAYAQYYLKEMYDEEGFVEVLNEVINVDIEKHPEMRLLNTLSQKQAKELLEKKDELFFNFEY